MGEYIMIFLTTGEKIRTLRKKFNMRQQELEDKNITRAFISMIETGKRGLSKESAKHISGKLNNKAVELGLNLNIDEAYLLRTPEEDAEMYCLEKLTNNPTFDEIDVIINISKEYNLIIVEAQAYKIIGDYNYMSENYVNAFINYMVSLDLFKETECKDSLPYLYNKLALCKTNQFEYIEAISFLNRANHYAKIYNDKITEKLSLYNLARAYNQLYKYNEALDCVDKYLNLSDKEKDCKDYTYASVLKANCYNSKGNSEKATAIFIDLLEMFKDKETDILWYVFNNLAITYLEQDNLSKSLEFFEKAEKAAGSKNISDTYIQEARVYIKLQRYEDALNIAKKGLKIATEDNDKETMLKGYYVLVDIYNITGDFQGLKTSYIKLLEILKNKEHCKDQIHKIYNRLALLYLEQNDIEMCKKYLNMAS